MKSAHTVNNVQHNSIKFKTQNWSTQFLIFSLEILRQRPYAVPAAETAWESYHVLVLTSPSPEQ